MRTPPIYKTPHFAVSQLTLTLFFFLPVHHRRPPRTSDRAPMAHNDQASGSHGGGGYARPTNLNSEEAHFLANNIPSVWHMSHG
jgi:hypothetical protein